MPVTIIRAHFVCDGCGKPMTVDMDAAKTARANRSLHTMALDYLGMFDGSVQGDDECLCQSCTSKVDNFVTEDRNATSDEIRAALA